MLKIATWNINSLRVRKSHVIDWLNSENPDVLALQEIKLPDESFPVSEFTNLGYQSSFTGQKTYNGVAILSRKPADITATDFPGYQDPQRRILCTHFDQLCVLNLYVPNGSEVGTEKYQYKLEWLSHLHSYLVELLTQYKYCVLLGDLNIAPADEDIHDPAEWKGKVLCSGPERESFFRLIDAGLTDCFRMFNQESGHFSWWDYRAASFRRNRGLRIDHILASDKLAGLCRSCQIDTLPRTLERPSDHVPVFAEFDL